MEQLKTEISVLIDQRCRSTEQFLCEVLQMNFKFIDFSSVLNKEKYTHPALLVFTGGADVDPKFYNEVRGKYTSTDPKRDAECFKICKIFPHIPKFGICRGSQFLTVQAGGKLVQHCDNHGVALGHTIDIDEEYLLLTYQQKYINIPVTSTHHQMMFPYNLPRNNYRIIGWAEQHLSTTYLDGDNNEIDLPTDFKEPEIVYYPKTMALAVQGHPEFATAKKQFKQLTGDLIKHLLL